METLGKEDLIRLAADSAQVTIKASRAVIDGFLEEFTEALLRGDCVRLQKIGKFTPIDVPEKPGVNPQTGEPMTIKAHKRIKVTVSDFLRRAIH